MNRIKSFLSHLTGMLIGLVGSGASFAPPQLRLGTDRALHHATGKAYPAELANEPPLPNTFCCTVVIDGPPSGRGGRPGPCACRGCQSPGATASPRHRPGTDQAHSDRSG